MDSSADSLFAAAERGGQHPSTIRRIAPTRLPPPGVVTIGGMSAVTCSGCAISVRLQCLQGVLFKARVWSTQVAKVIPPLVFDW